MKKAIRNFYWGAPLLSQQRGAANSSQGAVIIRISFDNANDDVGEAEPIADAGLSPPVALERALAGRPASESVHGCSLLDEGASRLGGGL